MNYKNADDERIKKNRQAVDKDREVITKKTNLEHKTYSGKALTALAKGEYTSLKGNSYNKVPELKNNSKPNTRYDKSNLTTSETRKSTRNTKYDNDFKDFYDYRFGDFSGSVDYDPKTDTDVETWRNKEKQIKKKYNLSDSQFKKEWEDYLDEYYKKQEAANLKASKTTNNVANTIGQFMATPGTWLEGAANTVGNIVGLASRPFSKNVSDKLLPNESDDLNFMEYRSKEGAKQAVKEDIKSDKGKVAYDVLTGLGDMGLSMALGNKVAPILQALPVVTRTQSESLANGTTPTRAAATGLASGTVSALMNAVGLDKLKNTKMASKLANMAVGGAVEGSENALEDTAHYLIDQAINKENSQRAKTIQYYMSQGMTEDEAKQQANSDVAKDLGASFIMGDLFGTAFKGLENLPRLRSNADTQRIDTGDPTVDNAIKQTVDAEAKIQENVTPNEGNVNRTVSNSTPRNPREIKPLEGERRTQALEERKSNLQRIKQLNNEIKAQEEVVNKAPKKAKKAEKQKLDALKTEKTGLQSTNKKLGRQINGAIIPMKEILEQNNKDLYDRIYKRNTGLMDNLNYVAKHAGDTAEAKQLAKDIKNSINEYVETGDINSLYSPETIEKINRLDDLARTTDAEYIGHYKDNALFTDENGNPSIWNALEGASEDDLGLTGQIGKLHDSLFDLDLQYFGIDKPKNELAVIPETTSAPTEPIANTEPIPPGNNPPNNVPEVGEKVRSFSKRGSMDDTLPDEVRNVLKSDYYKVARNADTEAKANSLFDENNLTQTRSNLEQLLDKKDPASALLSYKLAGAYVDAKEYDAATDVLRQVSEKLTEAGQFTQAAKLAMVKNDPMAALRMYQRDLDSINQWGKEKYGKKWEKLKLTDADKEAFRGIKEGDAEALSDLVDNLNSRFGKEIPSTWWDKVVSATKTSMLLNPRTQFRNVTANMALLPIRSATDRVSALGQNIVHLIDPDVKVTQSLTGGSKEQKDIAGKIFDNMKSEILGENKMKDSTKSDILSHRQTFNDDFLAKWVDNLTNGGIGKLNEKFGADANKSTMETLQNFTYWLMGDFGDAPFVKKNFVNRLASYMKAQGINNIDDVPDDAIALATQEALKATFKDDNAFTKALQGVKQKTGKFGEVALPFTKTPANLAVRAYDYSPLGIISTIKKAKSGAEIGEVIDDLSKNLTGTAMILLGMKLRDKGILSGNYSDDKDEAAAQKRQGMLENAFHIGNKYFTYDWAQPAATPLVLGSVIQDAINASDEQNKEAKDIINASWRGGIKVANTIINSSPLQSLSDMLGSSSYSDDDGPAENIAKEIIEFPQRFIPSVLGATARVSDPYYRETYTNDGGLTGILKSQVDSAKAKIPELSKTLPISYDTWGQARRRSNTTGEAALAQYVNPGQFGIDTSIPIDKDIQAIYDATGNNAVFPKYAPRSVDLGNDGTIKLDNRQHSEYQKELGQLSRDFAEGLLGNSEFKNLSDDQKAEMLGKAYNFANAKTKEKLFDHVTDVGKHLNEAYESGGVDGAVKYWINKSKADELGLTYDTYIKKESEQPGSAAQYAQDSKQLNAINEKYGTNMQMSTYEKYGAQGVEQRAQNTNEALKYGFVDKDGGANIDSYEKAVSIVGNNDASLRAYSDYKKQGFEKNNQRVPYLLDNNSFSAEQKGMIIAGTNPDKLSKTAKELYNVGGYEGVWDYYMLKNMFDKDDSGGLNKKEKSELYTFMNSDSPYVTSIPDDVYYYLGSIKRW